MEVNDIALDALYMLQRKRGTKYKLIELHTYKYACMHNYVKFVRSAENILGLRVNEETRLIILRLSLMSVVLILS